jgi:hypothetical protein
MTRIVTVPLDVAASLSFELDDGEELTLEMLNTFRNEVERMLDRGDMSSAGRATFPASIYRLDKNSPISVYDQETGTDEETDWPTA